MMVPACVCGPVTGITSGAMTSSRIERADGRAFRMLVIVDEHTRECLAIDVARKLTSEDLLERLSDLFICRGVPDYVRSDNGPEFTAHRVRDWLETVEVKTLVHRTGFTLGERLRRESSTASCVTSCSIAKSSTRCWKRRCSSSVGGGRTTPSVRTAPWATNPRRRKRSSPVRSLRLRLSKRTGLVCWQRQP